jgi:hypothetical protein
LQGRGIGIGKLTPPLIYPPYIPPFRGFEGGLKGGV